MGLLTGTQQDYYDSGDFGGYQFTSLSDIINNFTATYIGEGKLLEKTNRADVSFHAMRAMQELSFDTFKSCKAQEIEIPPSLTMPLPRDYVNYVKLSWSDSSGIEHIIYPTSKTSNPKPILQNSDGDYNLTAVGTLTNGSTTIVLDSSYTGIYVGMIVDGAGITTGSTVTATSTVSGITTIVISNTVSYNTTVNLNFLTPNGDLLEQQTSSLVLTGLSWPANVAAITASSSADASTVAVGMIISHEDFEVGTTVIDVSGSVIFTSTQALNGGTSENANFISTDKISDTWSKYKSAAPSENNNEDYEDDTYWPSEGGRYGLDPQHAQVNGSYYIDCTSGKIHFSSNLSGKTVILKYISDGLGTDEEMLVHKFAEEAIYKWIAYGCLSARVGIPEYIIRRFKKERFAETRKAKLRLSNIKLEEITQILRGKSKQIKH
jgi:hypothetical protein